MLKIYVGNSFEPQEVIVSENKTVNEVFEENSIYVPAGSIVTLGSRRLGDNELNKTLSELGVSDNSAITYSQKLNGAK
jgi:hypothetical protein